MRWSISALRFFLHLERGESLTCTIGEILTCIIGESLTPFMGLLLPIGEVGEAWGYGNVWMKMYDKWVDVTFVISLVT